MGYDIHMVTDPAMPIPGYEPQFDELPGYIRLAGMSMPYMVEIMLTAGILDDAEPPEFPPLPAGLTEDRAEELCAFFEDGDEIDPPPDSAERRLMEAFVAARREVEAARSQRGRVPLFKFRSNDDWLVCPEECHIIADGLRRFADANEGRADSEIEWSGVRQWAAYNRVAADHGGYRVG